MLSYLTVVAVRWLWWLMLWWLMLWWLMLWWLMLCKRTVLGETRARPAPEAAIDHGSGTCVVLQGRQDLNLQPAVLETAALPVELRPLAAAGIRLRPRNPSRKSGMCPPARDAGRLQHTPERPV